MIHIDDVEGILNDALGENRLSRREMQHLINAITNSKERGSVDYRKLLDVLEPSIKVKVSQRTERWYDIMHDGKDDRWATKPGSVGDWLKRAACPAEVRNFKRFVAALENFERDSGMKVANTPEGFLVPLGPDLRVSIKFMLP